MTMNYGRLRRWLMALLIAVLPPGFYAIYIYEEGNFHEVSEDRIYRARQLDAAELEYYIPKYNIRSILNLRGKNLGEGWYRDEVRVSQQFNIAHYDYGISANRELDDVQVEGILEMLRTAPKPILIHCKAGADRTSLVTALALYALEDHPAEEAAGQLSIWYGHLPFFGNSTAAMDRTFWRYVDNHPVSARIPTAASTPVP